LIFVGHDWAEDHHDVVVLDEVGERLASARLVDGVDGVAGFHGLVAESVDEAEEVVIGTETDRGLFVGALVAAGYQVFAVNPKAVDRYRDRVRMAGGKSDAADAKVLADLVRTDRHLHRPVAADSELAEALKVLTRAHKDLIWQRQGQVNQLRSALREYYPGALEAFATELAHPDALAVLALAPTPEQGRRLSQARIASALRRAGRQRNVEVRARTIRAALGAVQLRAADDGEHRLRCRHSGCGRGAVGPQRPDRRDRDGTRAAFCATPGRRDLSQSPRTGRGPRRPGAQ
jgi:transposase